MPVTSEVFVDPLLSNVSVKYTNPAMNFIAEKVFPTVNVDKKTGFYFTYDKSNLRVEQSERTGVSRANRVDYSLTKTAYGPLIEHSLEEAIEQDILDQYQNPLEPRTDAAMHVTEKLLLKKEKNLATYLGSTSNITQNVTLTTTQWSDPVASDPFNDIQTGLDTIQQNGLAPANTLVLGYQVWSKLKNHPDLLERVKYSQKAVLTTDLLASLWGLQNIFVGSTVENTAKQGQTDATSFIWGKNALLMYVTPTPGIRTISSGYHLQLSAPRYIERWYEQWNKAEFVRVTDYFKAHTIAVEAMYLVKNAVA